MIRRDAVRSTLALSAANFLHVLGATLPPRLVAEQFQHILIGLLQLSSAFNLCERSQTTFNAPRVVPHRPLRVRSAANPKLSLLALPSWLYCATAILIMWE